MKPLLGDEDEFVARQARLVRSGEPFLARLAYHRIRQRVALERAAQVTIRVVASFERFNEALNQTSCERRPAPRVAARRLPRRAARRRAGGRVVTSPGREATSEDDADVSGKRHADLGYVVVSGLDFVGFMRRAAAGESPDLLFVEFAANSDIEHVDDGKAVRQENIVTKHDSQIEHSAEQEQGVIDKYTVRRNDDPTGKHDDCRYFVLDPQHDPLARRALLAYADAAEAQGYNRLSLDLRRWVSQ